MSADQAARVRTEPAPTAEPVSSPFDVDIVPIGIPQAVPEAHDRLVRHLFDIGLQLHSVRAIFEGHASTPEQIRTASDCVLSVLDDLDTLIRDAGLAMLDLATRRDPPRPNPVRPAGPHRRRRRS
ncbi:hypothetical protein NDR87_29845 [Nocardia sp. CDC159]|uniref:Uncharacterized protein n=1 Tax=Nocardia pulmonis TaxID=2951408 RepID=A0A9X2EDS8_9NOCA|nr:MULTISPECIES: hypothetical protein [Nocardia]MCM6777615.1 hypothetical protein [Nocardia pulmonis]MCM6790581.1 hypothetical protein [Nocardia sp. CDC159]